MPGDIFLLPKKRKGNKNSGNSICHNVCSGSSPALASCFSGKDSVNIFGLCPYRHLFCVAAVPTLCPRLFDWMAVDANNRRKNGGLNAGPDNKSKKNNIRPAF